MGNLVLPERVTIQMVNHDGQPARLYGLPFSVHTCQCRKNNYVLGAFFSDAEGRVVITRELCELSVRDELDTGLMDYGHISECSPDVEIKSWSPDDIDRVIDVRRKTWTMLLSGEQQIYRSLEELLQRLQAAPRLHSVVSLRDRWDGKRLVIDHQCVVRADTPA
jgi:hypothetical protein